ncbi:MAG: response regulator [Desulfarculus sp.]|nr:response regulator [Desulfarculus sp.]
MTKTKVLIVDDEKENIRYLTTILEENGFRSIYSAADGDEGLKRVKEVMPGLIVLDVRMPKKSGIQVFNELRKIWKYKDIPVIILTGEGEFLKQLAALREFHEGGALTTDKPTEEVLGQFIKDRPEAFLEKPIAPEAFMAAVRKVLGE